MSTAPASFSRATTAESVAGTRLRNGSAPYVVAMPAVSSRSFTPYGMPCSGPRYLPAAISASACFAPARARRPGERDDGAQLRIEPLDPLEIDVRQPLGRQRLASRSSARACVTGAKAMSASFDGQRHRRRRDFARTGRAPGPFVAPVMHRIPARRRRERPRRAPPSAARCAARTAAPSTGASLPAAISRSPASSSPARASPLRRTSPARPRDRRRARCRTRAARRASAARRCGRLLRRWQAATPTVPIAAVIRNCLRVFMRASYPRTAGSRSIQRTQWRPSAHAGTVREQPHFVLGPKNPCHVRGRSTPSRRKRAMGATGPAARSGGGPVRGHQREGAVHPGHIARSPRTVSEAETRARFCTRNSRQICNSIVERA